MKLYNYKDQSFEVLRDTLTKEQSDISLTRKTLKTISYLFFKKILNKQKVKYFPIIIMRGGLLMYEASLQSFTKPISYMMPPKRIKQKKFKGSADLAELEPNSKYLFVDPIINTGKTITNSILFLKENAKISNKKISFAFLFGTETGLNRLSENYKIEVHAVWSDYDINKDGFLDGIGYDAGHYASNQNEGNRILI